jgi:hypothetical protein
VIGYRAPMQRSILRVLVLAVAVSAPACGGSSAAREGTAPSSAARDEERPESDRGLATWPRTDAPPFPPRDFARLVGSPDRSLPPDRLAAIAAFVRWYELDPYDPAINGWGERLSTRAALMLWVVGSPDVHVVASTFLEELASQRGEDGELVGRYATIGGMLGMAAHAIEQPGLQPTDPVRQAAGVESALRWYEAAVRRGAARSALLDELRGVRDRGELAAWIQQRVTFH